MWNIALNVDNVVLFITSESDSSEGRIRSLMMFLCVLLLCSEMIWGLSSVPVDNRTDSENYYQQQQRTSCFKEHGTSKTIFCPTTDAHPGKRRLGYCTLWRCGNYSAHMQDVKKPKPTCHFFSLSVLIPNKSWAFWAGGVLDSNSFNMQINAVLSSCVRSDAFKFKSHLHT